MRTLKICLVMTFFLAALTPAISTRVAALTATLAQNKTSKENPAGTKMPRSRSKVILWTPASASAANPAPNATPPKLLIMR